MIRGRFVGPLALGTDDDAREPPEQMPLPTLDERANLYLRAVYGDREFAPEEHAGARERILKAMAAGLAARADRRLLQQDGASLSIQFSAGVELAHLAAFTDASLAMEAFEPGPIPGSAGGAGFGARQAAARGDLREAAAVLPGFQAFSHRRPPFWVSAGQVANRIAPICVAAILAAAAGYWMAGIFPLTGLAPNTPEHGPHVAGQAAQPELSGRTRPGLNPPVMAEAQREVASALNAAQLQDISALLKHGQDLIADGKFRHARLVLGRAAEAGSAPAALALGQTYDPVLAERPGVRPDAPPNVAMARAWYEKAKALGAAEAARRLSQLPAPLPAPAPRSNPR